jgi:hypothetical protein
MIVWFSRHPQFRPYMLGFIPNFLDDADPRDAKAQLDAGYGEHASAGYWQGADQHVTLGHNDALLYPGDPPQPVLAECRLRGERVLFYPHDFVGVVAADGTFSVQRMD